MLLLLLACGAPHDTRPPRTIADEVRLVDTVPTPLAPLELRAIVKAVDHPPRTGGWEGSEIGPVPTMGGGEWVETWVEVRAWSAGFTPVVIDRPEEAGYLLAHGRMQRGMEDARADQAATTVTRCWSTDQHKLALLADAGGSGAGWVVFDFAETLRIGQFMDASGTCEAALTAEPLTWHSTTVTP